MVPLCLQCRDEDRVASLIEGCLQQAYTEIRDDGHPIVVISGRDICEILAQNGITTGDSCDRWLDKVLGSVGPAEVLETAIV